MKKKTITIIVVIAIIADLAASLFLVTSIKRDSNKRNINDVTTFLPTDEVVKVDNTELAKEIAPITNLTEEQVKEDLDKNLTNEQHEVVDEIIDSISAPASDSEITVYGDGTISYTDATGNVVVETPDETILNMTDEEIKADTDRILSELEAIAAGEKTSITPNSNPAEEVVPNGVDNGSEPVSNTSNSMSDFEKQMQAAFEEGGYVGSTTGELSDAAREEIAGSIQLDP